MGRYVCVAFQTAVKSVKKKGRGGIIFVPDLVNRLFPALTGIEAIRGVKDQAIGTAHVPVGMDHPCRHNGKEGIPFPTLHYLAHAIGWRMPAAVPEIETKDGRADKAEAVSLVAVFMGTASNSGTCHGNVGHCRCKTCWQFISTEKLRQPAPTVAIAGKALQ
jgi:hypothetical protein